MTRRGKVLRGSYEGKKEDANFQGRKGEDKDRIIPVGTSFLILAIFVLLVFTLMVIIYYVFFF